MTPFSPPAPPARSLGAHHVGIAGRTRDRRFFAIAALAVCAIVFTGFARTYYLKAWFGTPAMPLTIADCIRRLCGAGC